MGDMSTDLAMALSNEMLWTAVLISLPALGLSMAVGLFISIIQVVTQIQEMSLTFVPKIISVAMVLGVAGGWMLMTLVDFAKTVISNIPAYF